MKRIIFGDVHGNYLGVESILSEVNYNNVDDIIVFVGDYCDHFLNHVTRNAKKTLDLLCKLQTEAPEKTFFVLGNHDLWFREWIDTGGLPKTIWYLQGGRETISSYLGRETEYDYPDLEEARYNIPREHKVFLTKLLQYYVDDEVVCVHGGFPFETEEQFITLQAVKEGIKLNKAQEKGVLWDRTFWRGSVAHKERFRDHFGNRYLITGHTQRAYDTQFSFDPTVGPFVNETNKKWINIDSDGLHAVVIENNTYKIVGQNEEWE